MISVKLRKTDSSLENYLNKNKADLLVLGTFLNESPKLSGLDNKDVKRLKEAISVEGFTGKKQEKLF